MSMSNNRKHNSLSEYSIKSNKHERCPSNSTHGLSKGQGSSAAGHGAAKSQTRLSDCTRARAHTNTHTRTRAHTHTEHNPISTYLACMYTKTKRIHSKMTTVPVSS